MITELSQLDRTQSYTYADYLQWKFKERVELLKGFIRKMAAPTEEHQRISMRLTSRLDRYFENHTCNLYSAPFDVRLFDKAKSEKADKDIFTVVQPDLCVICDREKIDKKGCIGAPDLIVEILSKGNSKKEMDSKFSLYEEAGVREYWIVDPKYKTVLLYTLNPEGKYYGIKPFTEDQQIFSVIFPDMRFDLKPVFAPIK